MWNDDATDAVLLDSSANRTFSIIGNQGSYDYNYYYPSRSECIECHTPEAGFILGVKTSQINKQHLFGEVSDNQLRSYNKIRLFTENIGEDYNGYPKLTNPDDTTATIEDRARSYLDANCANCHLPGGSGRTNIDFRSQIPLESAHLVGVPATLSNMGIEGAQRLMPGAPDSSVIYLRMEDTTTLRMPPLATSIPDEFGTNLIKSWIDSLGILQSTNRTVHQAYTFELYPAYPNPFNPVTAIGYRLSAVSFVDLSIYNLLGQKVKSLVSKKQPAGEYQIEWNASGFASGIYFYHLTTNTGFSRVRKLVLLK